MIVAPLATVVVTGLAIEIPALMSSSAAVSVPRIDAAISIAALSVEVGVWLAGAPPFVSDQLEPNPRFVAPAMK
jgi:hypothetical protein